MQKQDKKREEYRTLLAQNIDPQAHCKAQNTKQKLALDHTFYSNRGKRPHIERARTNEWLRNNGYQGIQSLHGLRATARAMLEEILDYPPHIIEVQLGHQVKDMNGTAYNRTKFMQNAHR